MTKYKSCSSDSEDRVPSNKVILADLPISADALHARRQAHAVALANAQTSVLVLQGAIAEIDHWLSVKGLDE